MALLGPWLVILDLLISPLVMAVLLTRANRNRPCVRNPLSVLDLSKNLE